MMLEIFWDLAGLAFLVLAVITAFVLEDKDEAFHFFLLSLICLK